MPRNELSDAKGGMGTERKEKSARNYDHPWIARGFGMLISGFLLFMFIGETWEAHLRHAVASGDIKPIAAIGLGLMGIYIIAMLLASDGSIRERSLVWEPLERSSS